jgi:moderate conductance mechanosensitive channel
VTPSPPRVTDLLAADGQEVVAVYDAETVRVCGDGIASQVGLLCPWVLDLTGNEQLARGATTFVAIPFRILFIMLGAVVLRWVIHRAVNRLVTGTARSGALKIPLRGRQGRTVKVLEATPLLPERREQRAATIGSVLKSLTTVVVSGVAVAMSLSEVGFNLAPVLASAGIVGVAVGFGAQTLVRDFLSGIFMILEDQFGVGDVIDAGEASGVVEAVALRTTRLRDVNGTVWHIRNGEILRVGNQSQGWSRALLDVSVAYTSDIEHVKTVIKRTADAMRDDPELGQYVLEEPEVWGLERMDPDAMVVRLVVKTAPLKQWDVGRALRQRIKEEFEREGIEIPLPQRSIWLRTDGPGGSGAAGLRASGGTATEPAAGASTGPVGAAPTTTGSAATSAAQAGPGPDDGEGHSADPTRPAAEPPVR